jgi:glyoxylase-like metal-dependent hydrolase (beta-lactamase superfamily II)
VGYASRVYSDDHAAARRSVQRLAALDVRTVVFGHYPALTSGAPQTLARLALEEAGT